MPTYDQINELLNETNIEETTVNNVIGYKFINKSDETKYIFVPMTGYFGYSTNNKSNQIFNSNHVYIPSSKVSKDIPTMFYCLDVYSSRKHIHTNLSRCFGFNIRGVYNSISTISEDDEL